MLTTSRIVPSAPADADHVLRDALEAKGQRYTDQRAAVYRFLCSTTDHPTADEVFTAVRHQIADISLATVYKALETLVSCELAIKLTYGDGSARYDARTDDHCHSRCLSCGSVRDVPDGRVPSLPPIAVGEGFQVHGYRVEVVGYCSQCAPT
ncbi:MAG TPA: transcriptional repressor [Longimicrobiaceae bacterium]|nr:transcriptional repressor [Longimicrobiaceae bacterium]